jgi:cytochrome P450
MEWSKRLASNIVHFSTMADHIVILHKMEDVTEILEKRSGIYCSRPEIPIMTLMKTRHLTPALPYGSIWRGQRKILQEGLKKEAVHSYHHVLSGKVRALLGRLVQDPAEFREHLKVLPVSAIMAVSFGYEVLTDRENDRFVQLPEFVGSRGAELVLPGYTLVNVFPFLTHIPSWFPGASIQKVAVQIGEAMTEHKNGPFEYVKYKMATGASEDCILARILESRVRSDGSPSDEDEVLKDAMATIYIAGVDTVWSVLTTFVLAMALHPLVQKKALEEIDTVVGFDRLPRFDDRGSLPYIEALYREVLRWRPVTPIGFPHTSLEDDIYRGFYFPKGTLVMPNIWAITRDEAVYPDPESFKPERFLEEDGSLNHDDISYVFGFGRRLCPGKDFSDAMVWLAIVSVLSMFKISKSRDENGNEIHINKQARTDSFISHPVPFQCSITPRSPKAEALARINVA